MSGWCSTSGGRSAAKAKSLPPALAAVLQRLAADGPKGYRDAGELLQELERAGGDVPANAEAWDRLLKHVREHGTPEAVLRFVA